MFLVFVGRMYYPNGGAADLLAVTNGEAEALQVAKQAVTDEDYEWVNTLDTDKMLIVRYRIDWDETCKIPTLVEKWRHPAFNYGPNPATDYRR